MTIDVKDKILNSAEQVCIDIGAVHLTLKEVAKRSGVSKSGLLYHYPNKLCLLENMIKRAINRVEKHKLEIKKTLPDTPSRNLKAHVISRLNEERDTKRLFPAVLGALAHDKELVKSIERDYTKSIESYIKDGLDPVITQIILFALDGKLFIEALSQQMTFNKDKEELEKKLLELCEKAEKSENGGNE